MTDILLFVVFPYVALAIGIVGTIYRYLTNQYSFTSLSSQFLENDLQFWGSTLWHYGILPTTIIHIAGFAIPKVMAAAHGTPELLYVSELAGKILGIMALVGAGILLYRRLTSSKIRAITTPVDWVILSLVICAGVLRADPCLCLSLGRGVVYLHRHTLDGLAGVVPARAAICHGPAFGAQSSLPHWLSVVRAHAVQPIGAYRNCSRLLFMAQLPTRHLDATKSNVGNSDVE
jgi:hypothetical protein